jgi:zinc transport system ATP-binding protein
MSNLIIEVKNLNYKDILKDVSFTISNGDYTAIIGPNGAGKSTLLKLLLSLLKPSSGSVYIDSSCNIGYVPQRVAQIDNNFPISVREVIEMGFAYRWRLFRVKNREESKSIDEVLSRVNILHLKDRQISNLSGGERQKVMIARALVSNPSLLILDEPNTGIDQNSQREFYKLLKALNVDGIAILFVTHDLGVIVDDIKSIIAINQKMIYCKNPKDILECSHMSNLYGVDAHIL